MSPPLDFSILQAAGMDAPSQGWTYFFDRQHDNFQSENIISNFNPGQSHDKNEILGKITLRHAYEIADYHAKDDWYIAR